MKFRICLSGLSLALLLVMGVRGQDEPPKKFDEPTDSKPALDDKPALTEEADLPSASPEEIRSWVTQLSSRKFSERETATKKLSSAGGAAAIVVAQAGAEGPVEVGLRSVSILDALYKTKDGKEAGVDYSCEDTITLMAEWEDVLSEKPAHLDWFLVAEEEIN